MSIKKKLIRLKIIPFQFPLFIIWLILISICLLPLVFSMDSIMKGITTSDSSFAMMESNPNTLLIFTNIFRYIILFSGIIFFFTLLIYLFSENEARSEKAGGIAKTSLTFITASGIAILAGLGFHK